MDGFRIPLVVTLRALPDIESEVPSRLIVGVPVRPEPLDPEAVRVLNRQIIFGKKGFIINKGH